MSEPLDIIEIIQTNGPIAAMAAVFLAFFLLAFMLIVGFHLIFGTIATCLTARGLSYSNRSVLKAIAVTVAIGVFGPLAAAGFEFLPQYGPIAGIGAYLIFATMIFNIFYAPGYPKAFLGVILLHIIEGLMILVLAGLFLLALVVIALLSQS